MILTRTEWAMRFAATFLDLLDGGVELRVLRGWGEELYVRLGHLDPGHVARQQFEGGRTPAPQHRGGAEEG